jgi:protocatechuate 3,4-dioxygenase beta subunit
MRNSESSSNSTLKATTNEEGKYRIGGISPGTYVIAPIAWGFVPSEANYDSWDGKSFVIAEDESIENVDFAFIRGGVITGKVTDANGRPVIEETVNLTLADQLRSSYSGVFPFQTDDRGIYRIFGIPAGRFKVSVGQGDRDLNSGMRGRTTYRKTFFPNVTDPTEARLVDVSEGSEITNVDIIVGPKLQGFTASGRVVDGETGKPCPNMAINLTRTIIIDANSSSSGGSASTRSDREGEFKIENLVPGKYTLSMFSPPQSDLRADPVSFDLIDQDASGLIIKTSAGASVEGVVVVEGVQDKNRTATIDRFYLMAIGADEGNSGSVKTSRIESDGRFRINGMQSGRAILRLAGRNNVKGLVILRVEREGTVQPSGIRIEKGEHLTDVRVIVAFGTSTIRGVVKLENGTLAESGRLSIHLSKPADPSFSEEVAVDSRGHFVSERLLAGSYELTVYVFGPVSPQGPRTVKQFVNVAEGAVTEVMVTVDLKQNPTPGGP